MKLLHVLHSLKEVHGGPIRAVLDLSALTADFGLESEVLGFGALDTPNTPFSLQTIHCIPISRPYSYCYAPLLKSWLRKNLGRFDGVILHGMWLYPNLAVSSVCREMGVAYACFTHGMLEPWAVDGQGTLKALKKLAYWNLFEKNVIQGAKCIYFSTERERSLAKLRFHLGGTLLVLAPYGVKNQPARSVGHRAPTGHQRSKNALFLGRLHPTKNVGFLIQAWHRARPPEPWHLIIAGSGSAAYTRELLDLVNDLGLGHCVHFVGFVSGASKSHLLQEASWFLLPSKHESFGVAVLEAIAYGCPIAISDQMVIAELMHPRTEILSLAIEEWVTFIRYRMVDNEWRETSASLNRGRLHSTLGMQDVAKAWVGAFTEAFS